MAPRSLFGTLAPLADEGLSARELGLLRGRAYWKDGAADYWDILSNPQSKFYVGGVDDVMSSTTKDLAARFPDIYSRELRAAQQNYLPFDVYHGSYDNFDSVRLGRNDMDTPPSSPWYGKGAFYATTDPQDALVYGDNIYRLRLRPESMGGRGSSAPTNVLSWGQDQFGGSTPQVAREIAQERNKIHFITRNPNEVRAFNADFDPNKLKVNKLLAGGAGAAYLASHGISPAEVNAEENNLPWFAKSMSPEAPSLSSDTRASRVGREMLSGIASTGAELALGMTPGIGEAMSVQDAYNSTQAGDYGAAALAALGAVPLAGAGIRALRGGGEVAQAARAAPSIRSMPLDEWSKVHTGWDELFGAGLEQEASRIANLPRPASLQPSLVGQAAWDAAQPKMWGGIQDSQDIMHRFDSGTLPSGDHLKVSNLIDATYKAPPAMKFEDIDLQSLYDDYKLGWK